jgi:hypothetical protein
MPAPDSPSRRLTRTRRAAIVGAVGASLLAAACEDDGMMRPADDTIALGRLAEQARAWTPTEREQVTITLDMDSVIEHERPTPIRITVHNGSGRPISIGFGRQDAFQVLVARLGGRADTAAIWSPGATGSLARDAVITDPLPPGRDTVFQITWPAQDDAGRFAPPGRYRVRGYVAAELLRTNRIWTPWKQIEIRAPKATP